MSAKEVILPVNFTVLTLIFFSFEMKIGSICGRAFYPKISRFNHSCLPNLSHVNLFNLGEKGFHKMFYSSSFNNQDFCFKDPSQSSSHSRFFLRLISQLPISKGQELSIRYLSPMEVIIEKKILFEKLFSDKRFYIYK